MSQFRFSVRGLASRQDGVIESESFLAAVDALGHHVTVKAGDILEIGVYGFPPGGLSVHRRAGKGHADLDADGKARGVASPHFAASSINAANSAAFVVP